MKIFDPSQIHLYQPPPTSHKGQNGKLLVIGGSKLFHTSIFWAADVGSRIVDIVHLTSPANENNLVFRRRLKEKFWSGIVVDWADVEDYIQEDDCVLIGPGMARRDFPSVIPAQAGIYKNYLNRSRVKPGMTLKTAGEADDTPFIVDYLLKKYPTKRWVLDGGGLQGVEPGLITESCILTPHRREFEQLIKKIDKASIGGGSEARIVKRQASSGADDKRQSHHDTGFATATASHYLHNATILLKCPIDTICQGKRCVSIEGGNPGMTKGGTGDVLAGLVAALYCKNDSWTAATVASWVNKKAGDELFQKVGPYFNARDLVEEAPKILKEVKRRGVR